MQFIDKDSSSNSRVNNNKLNSTIKFGIVYAIVLFIGMFLFGNDIVISLGILGDFSVDTQIGLQMIGFRLTTIVNLALPVILSIITSVLGVLECRELIKSKVLGGLAFRLLIVLQVLMTVAIDIKCLTNLPSYGIGGLYKGL